MEYNIIVNSMDGSKAVEAVLERLKERVKELELEIDPFENGYSGAFYKLQEAIECELALVRATKGGSQC